MQVPDEMVPLLRELTRFVPGMEFVSPESKKNLASERNKSLAVTTFGAVNHFLKSLTLEEREEVGRNCLLRYITTQLPKLDVRKMNRFCIAVRRVFADYLHLEYSAQEFVSLMQTWGVTSSLSCSVDRLTDTDWNNLNSTPFRKWEPKSDWGNERQRKFSIVYEQGLILRDLILDDLKAKSRDKKKRKKPRLRRK